MLFSLGQRGTLRGRRWPISLLELISTEQRKTCCCSDQEVKRLLPLVRFSLMDTQFFRQDLDQEVESLFYTGTPARCNFF